VLVNQSAAATKVTRRMAFFATPSAGTDSQESVLCVGKTALQGSRTLVPIASNRAAMAVEQATLVKAPVKATLAAGARSGDSFGTQSALPISIT
jgi:hypothetical protein